MDHAPSGPRRTARRDRAAGRRGVIFAAVALVAAATLSGCATKKDLQGLQEEVRRLSERQDEVLSQLMLIAMANRDSIEAQSDLLFNLRGELSRELIEVQEQLITLQELTGQSQRNLASLREEIENRRNALDSDAPPMVVDSMGGSRGEQPPLEAVGTGQGREIYNAGITQFNRGSFTTARRAFERFLDLYPNHELAPDAHFYLADILAQENRLEEARDAFLLIPERFPTASRVPWALYRAGLIEVDLGNPAEARGYLERVVNSYPDSGVADLAQARLEEIG